MTTVLLEDLHTADDPHQALREAALEAAQSPAPHRLLVRCPDRATNGIRPLKADDVAAMLHRYAHVLEIGVTDGGTIVAAADLCARRGEVAVWTGRAIGGWHPSDIITRGLGGSETAAVRLAEHLAAMGYVVTLYGDFPSGTGMAGDVMLRHYHEFDPTLRLDALIGFRNATLFDQRPNADACILWLEDLAPAEGLTRGRAANLDRVVGVTRWHAEQIKRVHPWLDPDKVAAGRNGIVESWFDFEDPPDRVQRVVYSSSPDRGGDIVLECWPRIKERVPDAELILTYPRWFQLCAQQWQQAADHLALITRLLDQPGVSRIETGIGQRDLAHLLRSSMVWVNPGYYSPGKQKFEETSGITSLEAQAAGCVVVASNWGALTENVLIGTLLDGDPSDPKGSWREAFIEAVVKGLTDEDTQTMAQTLGPEYMRGMDWRGAAEQLAAIIWEECGKSVRWRRRS